MIKPLPRKRGSSAFRSVSPRGNRGLGKVVPPPSAEFLERAWSAIAESAAAAGLTVVLGTERLVEGALLATVLVIDADGSMAGFQDSLHEKAALCRAAENTCYFATVNYASAGSPTTSAVIRPDGTVLAYQPYGEEGLLVADIDIAEATGLLALRFKTLA